MKTIGNHEIRNFRRLDPPEIRYGNTKQVYEGELINDYTKKEQRCTWDSEGKVINRGVPQYDIFVSEAEEFLTTPPPTDK